MFDVAPTELLLVMVVALVVIGPKDLPKAMRFVGKWVGKARGMARHFRSGLDTMMREAELEELEKQWRKQNEDIMRQFPNADSAPEKGAAAGDKPDAAAITADKVSDNPDFDAAAKPIAEQAEPDAAEAKPAAAPQAETHIVPPRGSELP